MSVLSPLPDSLKYVVESYNAFCRTAAGLSWAEAEEWHEDRSGPYALGCTLDLYRFPQGHIQRDIVGAYVQAVLSAIAFSEEWERDFWNVPPAERARYLEAGRALYECAAMVRDVRLEPQDWVHLAGEIAYFGGGNQGDGSLWKARVGELEGAEVLEIGGSDGSDFVYLAVKGDLLLLASCGVWD